MGDNKPGQEPSMEEILSSIRRIIAEDDPGAEQKPSARQAKPAGAPPKPVAPGEEDDDVLELTEIVPEPEPKKPAAAAVPPATQPREPTPPAASAPNAPASPKETTPMAATGPDSLLSPGTATASTQALARLAKAASTDEKKPSMAPGITMEQFMVDLLTPMLREWLDKNLPEIVERVVEQEVKKLARRAELM
jgi:cell pole-organizing protein PopZ